MIVSSVLCPLTRTVESVPAEAPARFSSRRRRVSICVGICLAFLWSDPGPAAASAKIRDIPPTPHSAPTGTSLDQIAAAIRIAAEDQDWIVVGEVPGELLLRLLIRSHEANVVVGFDAENYWIEYRGSVNLDYSPDDVRLSGPANRGRVLEGPRIHKNYNVWVGRLADRIELSVKYPPQPIVEPATQSDANLLLIADELEKLDALRQRGVLTQEEFDQQKAKLLAQ